MNHPRLDLSWSIEIVLSFHETCENNRVTFASIARKGFPLDRRKVKVECTINKRKLNSTHFQIYAHRKRLEPPIESWKFSFHTFFFSITPLFRILINYNPLQSILAKKPVNPSNRIRETIRLGREDAGASQVIPFSSDVAAGSTVSAIFRHPFFLLVLSAQCHRDTHSSHIIRAHCPVPPPLVRIWILQRTLSLSLSSWRSSRLFSAYSIFTHTGGLLSVARHGVRVGGHTPGYARR